MTKKEAMNLLLTKIPEDKKELFVAELRAADSKEEREKLFKKYQITLTEEEKTALKARSNEIPDDELDEAAGGCCNGHCHCSAYFCG